MDLGWMLDVFLEVLFIKVAINVENSDSSKII